MQRRVNAATRNPWKSIFFFLAPDGANEEIGIEILFNVAHAAISLPRGAEEVPLAQVRMIF